MFERKKIKYNITAILITLIVIFFAFFTYNNPTEEWIDFGDSDELILGNEKTIAPPPLNFPVHGTIFLDSNIIKNTDPSTFQSLTYAGQDDRVMFDRRVDNWITEKAFLFNATFDDGLKAEFQINPEFNFVDSAQVEAEKYALVIGRLPTALRKELKTVSIHKGTELYGGGNNNILIHTGQTVLYEKDGILEETLVHEAAHTSFDPFYEKLPAWLKSQKLDGKFISIYAKENPNREDIAETFLLYLAIRYKSNRISTALRDSIIAQVPNRIKFFDSLKLDMYPIEEVIVE